MLALCPVRGLLLALVLVAGCRDRARPWEEGYEPSGGPAPPGSGALAGDAAPPQGGGPPGGSLLGDASTLLATSDDAGAPPPPVRVGGPWVRCYGNFRPSGDPVKDVTRLALLCGPENGMVRVSKAPMEGTVAEGQPPAALPLQAARGECYRIFAVAQPSVADLDVVVRSSRGAPIAADHGEDRWPVVQPDRPFCALEDDALTVEVMGRKGGGRFAAEVWRLRAPEP